LTPNADDHEPDPLHLRLLESARGERPMQGWERILFYLLAIYCGGEFITAAVLPAA
jgi:hypothetical protein